MINVLIVEDSKVLQEYLQYILGTDPIIKVIGIASSGERAINMLKTIRPAVILMDIHLPGIDGFETTRQIMSSVPVPIVICTATVKADDMQTVMQAIEAGAVAAIKKPCGLDAPMAEIEAAEIIKTVKLMAEVKVVRRWNYKARTDINTTIPLQTIQAGKTPCIVVIGASTGGPPAIVTILSNLSQDFSLPILIVQHIADGFTEGFVEWLATCSRLPVHIAKNGEIPLSGHVYVAPDRLHLVVGSKGEMKIIDEDPHRGLRPSVGVLFRSVAQIFGSRSIGVLLTGMGRDGAEELKLMSDEGALTIAQDEESSIVFGMPGEAVKLGAAKFVYPPIQIAKLLNNVITSGKEFVYN